MSTENKITVLGKTFNSEEERRAYFREELRKKLPELKLMEGFPIGEDEDILNLSDPPYYTACPNPWLNDFIAEWEEEKKVLEKQGLRMADFEVTEPYAADVSEGKNNPIYNAHSYHTKVPYPAIMRYILHYTQPGDIVFDGFAGTGMTGVAASMCENPESDMKFKIERELQNLKWGKRNAICGDLSPLASFISKNYNSEFINDEFLDNCNNILHRFNDEYGWMYLTKHDSDKIGTINYIVYSDVFECSSCENEILFFDPSSCSSQATDRQLKCKKCGTQNTKNQLNRVFETIYDSIINKTIRQAKQIPVLINYSFGKQSFEKLPDKFDFDLIERINSEELKYFIPIVELPDGYNLRQGKISHGLTFYHHFHTKRALLAISALYEYANKESNPWLSKFFVEQTVLGMSKIARYVPSHFSQVNQYLTGTLYVASQIVDVHPNYILKGKISRLPKAMSSIKNSQVNYTGTALATGIKKDTIDYIFTDPPFGANIMYSDLNYFWESWLRVRTNTITEAIENSMQNKKLLDYHILMMLCFQEYYKALKPGKWMTVEFSNTSAAVWNGIQTALTKSGFIVANISALDKMQLSFKAIVSPTAVKQDLIISCYKPSSEFDQKFNQHKQSDVGIWDFVTEHLEHLPIHLVSGNSTTAIIERSPQILFDRLIAFYVQRGLPVPIDAGKFQQGLRERFIERDGMFFTNEQVQEYDRKKAAVPNFVQLSIFVANEQDAIYWLRHILEAAPKTEQDLHPLWMKEVAGNMRKGDTLPEMRTILEENFLKNEKGQWYLPDPENEADLEKLRTKRLLKQFETYKTEAYKPKGRIKEARVEALRAGFKECYQKKDFKTIVHIGDRIPNNLLMEDEMLLQFYDIAASRI